jgi:hypothetical protein
MIWACPLRGRALPFISSLRCGDSSPIPHALRLTLRAGREAALDLLSPGRGAAPRPLRSRRASRPYGLPAHPLLRKQESPALALED